MMFKDNKYSKWYFSICERAKTREKPECYCEKHHILPRSLGGGNGVNVVNLTAREHFIAHMLLIKMVEGPNFYKMAHALRFMACDISLRDGSVLKRYRPKSSKLYEMAKSIKSGPMSQEHRAKISKAHMGKKQKPHTKEHIEKTRISNTGKKRSTDQCENISTALEGWAERKKIMDPEGYDAMRAKQSATHTGKILPEITCKRMGDYRRGKKRDPEIGKKISAAQRGKYVPKEVCRKIGDANKFMWTIIDPNKQIHAPNDLRLFCNEHSVVYSSLIKTFKTGKPLGRGRSKGWQVIGRTT